MSNTGLKCWGGGGVDWCTECWGGADWCAELLITRWPLRENDNKRGRLSDKERNEQDRTSPLYFHLYCNFATEHDSYHWRGLTPSSHSSLCLYRFPVLCCPETADPCPLRCPLLDKGITVNQHIAVVQITGLYIVAVGNQIKTYRGGLEGD